MTGTPLRAKALAILLLTLLVLSGLGSAAAAFTAAAPPLNCCDHSEDAENREIPAPSCAPECFCCSGILPLHTDPRAAFRAPSGLNLQFTTTEPQPSSFCGRAIEYPPETV